MFDLFLIGINKRKKPNQVVEKNEFIVLDAV